MGFGHSKEVLRGGITTALAEDLACAPKFSAVFIHVDTYIRIALLAGLRKAWALEDKKEQPWEA